MESVDFYEVFSAIVTCPHCNKENELDDAPARYVEGDDIECSYCEKVFKLGQPL